MLDQANNYLYIYVVDRDFGFAPNPFHGHCTLATCKPKIRNGASVGDWIMGVGGARLKAPGRCIFIMKITEIMTFDEYWNAERFQVKKAFRNGSKLRMVGDNIYHKDNGVWIQEDSHHSNPDGSPNKGNLSRDTSSDKVLISDHFYYFGSEAIDVDLAIIDYKNSIGYKKIRIDENVAGFIKSIEDANFDNLNMIVADPFQFNDAHKRVDQKKSKII